MKWTWLRLVRYSTCKWTRALPSAKTSSGIRLSKMLLHSHVPKWPESAKPITKVLEKQRNCSAIATANISTKDGVIGVFRSAGCSFVRDATAEDVSPAKEPASDSAEDELLERWKRFASPRLSGEEMPDVDALHAMMQKYLTPSLSWKQLRTLARATVLSQQCREQECELVCQVSNLLDSACSRKLKSEEQAQLLDQELRGVLLELAFLRLNKASTTWKWEGTFSYKRVLTFALLNEKLIAHLHKEEFLFLTFLAGLDRHFPGTNSIRDNSQYFTLPCWLRARLEEIVPRLTLGEAGIVAHALTYTRLRLTKTDDLIRNNLLTVLVNAWRSEIIDRPFSVTAIAKLLKDCGNTEYQLVKKFMDKFESLLPSLDSFCQIQLASLLTEGNIQDADLFINTFASSVKPHLNSLRIKEIEHICMILQFHNYIDDVGIYKAIEEALLRIDKSEPHSARRFISVITSLSRMGHFILDSIQKIIHLANRHCDLPTTCDEASLVTAGRELCSSLFPEQYSSPQMQSRELIATGALYLHALGNVAELDCCVEIEAPDYTGARLAPELRHRILSVTRVEPSSSAALSIRLDILTDVKDLLGEENVFYGKAFPHASFSSIVFCLRQMEPLEAAPLPSDFLDKLAAGKEVARPPQSTGKWFALLVPRRDNLNFHKQPIGILVSKIRQLQKLGYVPLIVQQWAYEKAKEKNRKTFIKKIISTAVTWKGNRAR